MTAGGVQTADAINIRLDGEIAGVRWGNRCRRRPDMQGTGQSWRLQRAVELVCEVASVARTCIQPFFICKPLRRTWPVCADPPRCFFPVYPLWTRFSARCHGGSRTYDGAFLCSTGGRRICGGMRDHRPLEPERRREGPGKAAIAASGPIRHQTSEEKRSLGPVGCIADAASLSIHSNHHRGFGTAIPSEKAVDSCRHRSPRTIHDGGAVGALFRPPVDGNLQVEGRGTGGNHPHSHLSGGKRLNSLQMGREAKETRKAGLTRNAGES